MTSPYLPGVGLGTPRRRSRLLFHWRARDLSLTALSGQVGAFSRAASATYLDANGATLTAVQQQPRWQAVDLDGDTIRETTGLLLGSTDRLSFPFLPLPGALTILVRFVELSTIDGTSGDSNVISIGAPNANGSVQLYKRAALGAYRGTRTGTTVATAEVALASAVGSLVQLRLVAAATGAITYGVSVAAGVESTAAGAQTRALDAAFAPQTLYLGCEPVMGGTSNTLLLDVRIAAGVRTRDQLLQAL